MTGCACTGTHEPRRIVLTGGPGAGKTAVLELMRKTLCRHVAVLAESAGVVFGGGFPRGEDTELRRSGQRAIFYVQRELEAAARAGDVAIALCDRGTVDGLAYWPGPADLWKQLGTSLDEQLARYDRGPSAYARARRRLQSSESATCRDSSRSGGDRRADRGGLAGPSAPLRSADVA